MSLFLSIALSFVSPVSAQTCEELTTCEYTGYCYETCRVNRRGQTVCNIVCEQECTTETYCTDDDNYGGHPCEGIVDYDELYACLYG